MRIANAFNLFAFFILLRGLYEVIRGAKGEDNPDIWTAHNKLSQGARLRFADLVQSGVGGKKPVLIGKVAIEVHAALAILVELSVTVVVAAFPQPSPGGRFALDAVRLN